MHMADALVAPAVAGTMYLCSTVVAGYSVKKIKLEDNPNKIAIMGVMGAFVFATQMINFTIPGTGSSGHLAGGILVSALLGPYAGFLTMIGVLLIQCLMFADGGILALGCNVWNMAFYGCFVGALLIWRVIMRNGVSKKKITAASIIGCIITLQLGAFSVTLETLASGVTELPFVAFVTVMQPIHLAIGLVEGLITAAVLCFVYEARPELLWGIGKAKNIGKGKLSFRKTILVLGVITAFIAGGISLVASAMPDGLEWSIKKLTGTTQLRATGGIYKVAAQIQRTLAILPDYAFKNSDAAAGTTLAGIVGGVIVVLLCVGCCFIFRLFRKKNINEQIK